jgi:3',5'-cyclic-AMP phosphodiesterase
MPGIFYRPISRRTFLGASSQAIAACALATQSRLLAADATAKTGSVRLALLSDTHIPADPNNEYRKFFPLRNLKTVIPQVSAAHPEGIIINGDAARLTGELGDYEALKQTLMPLAEQTPIYIGLGNHDHRANFWKVFDRPGNERQKVQDKHVLVIERPGIRFILLDSLLYVNQVAGLLGKTQRDWLSKYLQSSDSTPTVLFVHHTLKDEDGDLLDVERLFRVLRPHKKVKALFYGHSHEYSFAQEDGIRLVNLPAIGYNFTDKEPVGWVDAKFDSVGAELTLHAIGGNRAQDGKTTILRWRS